MLGESPVLVPLRPPQTQHNVAWDWAWASRWETNN